MNIRRFHILSFFTLTVFIFIVSCSPDSKKEKLVIKNILEVQAPVIPDSVKQLVLVYNETLKDQQAKLFTFQKDKEEWSIVHGPVQAGIGENGFAKPGEKIEGDGKSPGGVYKLGHLFTYGESVNTRMPFTQSTPEDKWIDDPGSPDYNRHVRGETSAKSYENLKLKSDHYKYCLVIEYNTNPIVKGKGSAIFFHLRDSESETTAGCVAVSESDMLQILKWLDPDKHPVILMGSMEVFLQDKQ